jgi:F0F1-type ATP synthase assembly protein I
MAFGRGSALKRISRKVGTTTVTDSPDDRSPVAKAMDWVSRIIAISLEMVLPGVAGHWLDGKTGTSPLFLLLGFALGAILAGMQLMRIVSNAGGRSKTNTPQPPDSPHDH